MHPRSRRILNRTVLLTAAVIAAGAASHFLRSTSHIKTIDIPSASEQMVSPEPIHVQPRMVPIETPIRERIRPEKKSSVRLKSQMRLTKDGYQMPPRIAALYRKAIRKYASRDDNPFQIETRKLVRVDVPFFERRGDFLQWVNANILAKGRSRYVWLEERCSDPRAPPFFSLRIIDPVEGGGTLWPSHGTFRKKINVIEDYYFPVAIYVPK